MFTDPDLCGFPPSTAVNIREMRGCSSRGLSKTISTCLPPSTNSCFLRIKCVEGLRL
uniref:Uncharacterized protein n=1 Tax=Esox lucius TaxID=8010 RepID=A0A3P8Y9H5_ESOLU